MIKNIYNGALAILRSIYGKNATFRSGQYEAIEAVVSGQRAIVVQKTGWGKSLVYFLSTKLLRKNGAGITFVISPLLVLMQNQKEAAEKMGLKCESLNNETKNRWAQILNDAQNNALDLIFITPETLFKKEVEFALKNIKIGIFVIDEAHCISDWGHDFRLDYSRIKDVVAILPSNVPVLTTTATANNRVVADLKEQLGNNIVISRGPLERESLWLQTINLSSKAERYAWLLDNLEKMPGSGIIYCLTKMDCDHLARFLRENGIAAASYHAGETSEENSLHEQEFKDNKLKVLVATTKLGMGYDKDDVAFVVHFQLPQNIVSYYQQIGRAGRKLEKAYAILLYGDGDINILNYFINHAFPKETETEELYNLILDDGGKSLPELERNLNLRRSEISNIISFLVHDGFLQKNGSKFFATPKPFVYDRAQYDAISEIRCQEMREMIKLTETNSCLSKYVAKCLEDDSAAKCGHCANCLGAPIITEKVSKESRYKAEEFIAKNILIIEPRKRWPDKSITGRVSIEKPLEVGFCLSRYGDDYGEMVKEDKTAKKNFRKELLDKAEEVIKKNYYGKRITHLTFVPSLRNDSVREFAERLAKRLGLKMLDLLEKTTASPQKLQQNSFYQCKNAFDSFSVKPNVEIPKNLIIIDDIVDSRWTFTACGYKLITAGAECVYPFALADSSNKDGDE